MRDTGRDLFSRFGRLGGFGGKTVLDSTGS